MTRRTRIALAGAGIVVLLLALALRLFLQPERFTRTVLDRAGKALGLEITASGVGEYRLRGTPQMIVRGLVVREPGATTPLLLAERALLSLPWSTIRARGDLLDATRIELDAPRLDVPALQRWLATRPQRETRIPTLTEGLRITRGRIDNAGWRIAGIEVQLPLLAPGRPVDAQIAGHYLDPPNSIRFDLAVAMTHPGNGAGVAVIGPLTIEREQWRMPARITLAGPVHIGDDDLRMAPARVGMSARYRSGDDDLPFVLGLHGPLLFDEGTWALAPASLVLRGSGSGDRSLLPDLQGHGALALGRRLLVQLQGSIAAWPQGWPSLPPPIGQSTSPLPFVLDYVGKPDLSDIAHLQLQRDATHFDGRFRAFDVTGWIAKRGSGSPLPPLDGTITTPRMEIAGARLEGVEITLDEPGPAGDRKHAMTITTDDFAIKLLAWFDVAGRHDLPWQHPRTPYRVWLSEIMLQQTQVQVVAPYFERFVAALPDVAALAAAPLDEVLALWSGLGYYARARNLHAAAKACVECHAGDLPRDLAALVALPGIGRSTAGAILAQAWGDRAAILDGNVKRVLARVHGIEGWPGLPSVEKQLWAIAETHLPATRLADYTQAQMDFGATLCTRHDPACVICPLQHQCIAVREGRVAELPTPKPGKPLPERRALMLWAEDADGRVLLQRRPPAGIWASLWSLPEHEDHAGARSWFEAHLDNDYDRAQALGPIAHGFTHYRLQIHPLRWRGATEKPVVRDNPQLRWVARDELIALGIPAPIRKLIGG